MVKVAGRYQGYHFLHNKNGDASLSFEVFWQHGGWFWRPLCRLDAGAVGPFTTSTQAYQNAARAIGVKPASCEAS
jgi:hypothetical protein